MDILNLLAHKAPPCTSTLSADGLLVSLSASLSDQLGYSPEDALNQPIEHLYSVESVRTLRALFANPPADELVQSLELTLIRHNGSLLHVIASGLLQWREVQPACLHLLEIPVGTLGRGRREVGTG